MAQWISVKDGLPICSEEVWVCHSDDKVTIGIYSGRIDAWCDIYGEDDGLRDSQLYNVTYWMPMDIPEPPRVPRI